MTLKEYPDWGWTQGVFTRDIDNLHLEVRWQRNYRYSVATVLGRVLDQGTRPSLKEAIRAAEGMADIRLGMVVQATKAAASED